MIRQKVLSSSVSEVGWENKVLEIKFTRGVIFKYFDVPFEVYEKLIKAESIGRDFAMFIKDKYKCEKVEI